MRKLAIEVELWKTIREFKSIFDKLCLAVEIPPTGKFPGLDEVEKGYNEESFLVLAKRRKIFELQRLARLEHIHAALEKNEVLNLVAEPYMSQLEVAIDKMTAVALRLVA